MNSVKSKLSKAKYSKGERPRSVTIEDIQKVRPNLSEEEAEEILVSIQRFCAIIVDFASEQTEKKELSNLTTP